jgi:hypothetical protein
MARKKCEVCGNSLIEVIPEELYRCPIDLLYYHVRPRNPSSSLSLKAQTNVKQPFVALTGELKVFGERVINALCAPEKGYSPVIVREVKTIYDVLEGRRDFEEWFTKVRQALSLKNYQLAKVLYDCLEGLRSQEARQLREQWYSYLASETRGYGLA